MSKLTVDGKGLLAMGLILAGASSPRMVGMSPLFAAPYGESPQESDDKREAAEAKRQRRQARNLRITIEELTLIEEMLAGPLGDMTFDVKST